MRFRAMMCSVAIGAVSMVSAAGGSLCAGGHDVHLGRHTRCADGLDHEQPGAHELPLAGGN
jgi:hypothetical protein